MSLFSSLAAGASSGGEAVLHTWIHASQHVDTREGITEREKITQGLCQRVCIVSCAMQLCFILTILNQWSWSSGGQSQPPSPGRRNESHEHLCERAALLSRELLEQGLWPAARTISTQKEKDAEPWGHASLSAHGDKIESKSGFVWNLMCLLILCFSSA